MTQKEVRVAVFAVRPCLHERSPDKSFCRGGGLGDIVGSARATDVIAKIAVQERHSINIVASNIAAMARARVLSVRATLGSGVF